MPVFSDDIARRTQAVSVQAAGRVAPVGQNDPRRAIPGLRVAIEELVECAHIRIEHVHGLPGRWDQDTHRLQDIHSGSAHDFEHIVQT